MRKCYERYVVGSSLEGRAEVSVLDVGGADVNGSYRSVFSDPRFAYVVADIAPGEGVSVVLDDPYQIPLEDASVDIVLSGQMLEHCEFFWLAFAEMVRITKADGYVFVIAPSAGPVHRYPVDCYRFYPDAFRALARYADCQLIDVWWDDRGPWRDVVGVFARSAVPRWSPGTRQSPVDRGPAGQDDFRGTPEEEAVRGDTSYLDVLRHVHDVLEPGLYLEIGVRHGRSMALARCSSIGIDPYPEVSVELPETSTIVELTSDEFFESQPQAVLNGAPDLVFIDGMHLFENVLRDFMHVERSASPTTLVVIDDVLPAHPAQAERVRRTRAWMGDVWKIHDCLKQHRPDLFMQVVDASPGGLLLVAGLDPADRRLWDAYNTIVRSYLELDTRPPPSILARDAAISGQAASLAEILTVMRQARTAASPRSALVAQLRAALALSAGRTAGQSAS